MAVNPELQGRVFPPTAPYLVGREKIPEFSRAVLSTNPINFDGSSVKSLGGHNMVTADSEIVDADGKHVVTAISTLVVRGDED